MIRVSGKDIYFFRKKRYICDKITKTPTMKSPRTLLPALLLLLLAAGCTPKPSPEQVRIDTLTAALDSLFETRFRPDEPGAAVIVVHRDSIIYDRGFGLARMDSCVPIDHNTMFNICSVSKQFSAVALLMLEAEGKLSLDDPVSKYFPQYKAPIFRTITLRHLMSHTSGIPDNRPRTPEAWARYVKKHKTAFADVRSFTHHSTEEESCGFMETLDTLEFAPGTSYAYQNPTFQLMQSIVEQASGCDFDTWMREHIFLPAGMEETTYFEPEKVIPRMAHGYEPATGDNPYDYYRTDDGRWEECDYGETSFFRTKADGGIYTTPLEFVRWDKAIFSNLLMSDSLRQVAHTPRIYARIPHTYYGYGWFIEGRPDRALKIYHTGDNGGFLIFEGRFPYQDIFYLIFANRPDWQREKTVDAVDRILQEQGWLPR